MYKCALVFVASISLISTDCDNSDRIGRLEEQTSELKTQLESVRAASDYNLEAKCSKDARESFNQNWSRDKDTTLLDFTNHYNKSLNKCFILVEYHYLADPSGTWTNHMTLTDVYENFDLGRFAEIHYIQIKPEPKTWNQLIDCQLSGQKCKSVDEFNALVRPYLNER